MWIGIVYLSLCKMPINLEHLLAVLSICGFHVNCESMISPTKLKDSTLSILLFSIFSIGFTVRLLGFLNMIYFDLFTFRLSLFIFSHSFILHSSLLIISETSFIFPLWHN